MKTISEIEKKFEEEFVSRSINGYDDTPFVIKNANDVKQFYRSKFTELLESLRMKEIDIDETGEFKTNQANRLARNGYNSCVEKINSKIDNLLK